MNKKVVVETTTLNPQNLPYDTRAYYRPFFPGRILNCRSSNDIGSWISSDTGLGSSDVLDRCKGGNEKKVRKEMKADTKGMPVRILVDDKATRCIVEIINKIKNLYR